MVFNSLEYIIFLPLVLILFFAIQHKFRVFILLIASYYFYMSWNPWYILLIIASTLTDFFAGLLVGRTEQKNARRTLLFFSILVNLGLLFFFKYREFTFESINRILWKAQMPTVEFPVWDLLLPVGISFYTFQTMSYTIDVFYRRVASERNLGYFALYVCFFPQLVAGPIERYSSLMPQLKSKKFLTRQQLSEGGRLILYGFFMKMVIADNIGTIVDNSFAYIDSTSGLNLLVAATLYSFQIYCDFHGYSIIAIGTARLFGINLTQNFNAPYLAHSLTDFWRRWHISLTTWFRDYLYYPLGGNRAGRTRWLMAIMIVFIVSGIWHGANWTFVIWGFFHGLITILEKILGADIKSTKNWINHLRSIFIFAIVTLLWIFFRSPDIEGAIHYLQSIFTNISMPFVSPGAEVIILTAVFLVFDILTRKEPFDKWIGRKPLMFRWSVYLILVFLTLARSGTDMQPFIYFQF